MSWYAQIELSHYQADDAIHWMAVGEEATGSGTLQIWFFGSALDAIDPNSLVYFASVEQVSAAADALEQRRAFSLDVRNVHKESCRIEVSVAPDAVDLILPSLPPITLGLVREAFVSALRDLAAACRSLETNDGEPRWRPVLADGAINPLWHSQRSTRAEGHFSISRPMGEQDEPSLGFVVHEGRAVRGRLPNDIRFTAPCSVLSSALAEFLSSRGQAFPGGRHGVKLSLPDHVTVTLPVWDDDADCDSGLALRRHGRTVTMTIGGKGAPDGAYFNRLTIGARVSEDALSDALAVALAVAAAGKA